MTTEIVTSKGNYAGFLDSRGVLELTPESQFRLCQNNLETLREQSQKEELGS